MGFVANLLGLGGNDYKNSTNYSPAIQAMMQSGALNPVNFDSSNQVANQQGQLANQLMAQAQGVGPSVAQNLLNQQTGQNIQQAGGMLASQKGINPALAARQILQNQAAQQQAAAGQGATLRAQEQLGAQGQLGGVLGQERQQDLGQSIAQTQSGLDQLKSVGALQNANDQLTQKTDESNASRGQGLLGGLLGGVSSLGVLGGVGDALGKIGSSISGAGQGKSEGGIIPGNAPLSGNSPVNDTVPAMLSPGEIVIPRTAAKNPEKAKEFIEALNKRHKMEAGEEPSFGHVLAAQRHLHGRLSALESLCYGGMVK